MGKSIIKKAASIKAALNILIALLPSGNGIIQTSDLNLNRVIHALTH